MVKDFKVNETTISWLYTDNLIKIEKYKVDDAKYFEKEKLVIIFYYDKSDLPPYMIGYNIDGTKRFFLKSTYDFGIDSFTNEPGFKNIPVIGWMKEGDMYVDYYFDLNPEDGSLTRYGRAY